MDEATTLYSTESEVVRRVRLATDEQRRDLVGGLIRYIKDGETDFGRLLFNYVHVEDYAQAMVEGWSELHSLIAKARDTGAMGLPHAELGALVQEICAGIADREVYTREEILESIGRSDFNETYWWGAYGGPILDKFESWIAVAGTKVPF